MDEIVFRKDTCDVCDREDECVVIKKWFGLTSVTICEKCISQLFKEF